VESQKERDHWEDQDIKMNFREIGWGGLDWIVLAQDRDLGGSCEHGNEPSGSIT
jgi:hypothetical protein